MSRPGPTLCPAVKRIFLVACVAAVAALGAQPPPPAARQELDFWLGDWEVFVDGKFDGTNRIERVLGGAALIENWHDADGHEGKSWFYFYPPENRWKQVWVTDAGGVKEKALTGRLPNGAVQFRGEVQLRDGRNILDRTTLTPLADGTVRQVIELSADGGANWKKGYDAIYRRKKLP